MSTHVISVDIPRLYTGRNVKSHSILFKIRSLGDHAHLITRMTRIEVMDWKGVFRS